MSLYNMLCGVERAAPAVLAMLGIGADEVPRFRDAWFAWADDAETDPVLVIHTRTGGGNREHYEAENEWLTTLPGYRFNQDDDFDFTYADFFYDVPEAHRADVVAYLQRNGPPPTAREKFEAAIEAIKSGPPTP